MTVTDASLAAPRGVAIGAAPRLPLTRVVSLAMRELRSGIRGFAVFIACVALGVMVIAAVGAMTDALKSGLERQGELILGGDAILTRTHARATREERAWLEARGRVSETATMRTMARTRDGEDQALVELKGVDRAYPLVGQVVLVDDGDLAAKLAGGDGKPRAAVDPILLERLKLAIGDTFRIGEIEVIAAAANKSEPDSLSDRLTFGPRIFVSLETMAATGLVKPGALVRWRYALKLGAEKGGDAAVAATEAAAGDRRDLASFAEAVKRDFPEAGFTVRDRRDPSPQVRRTLERLRQFLTLIGLTALLVGGVGVANAVQTFIDRRRKVIATMKSLGAPNRVIFQIFLFQVAVMSAVGVAIGVALGFVVPFGLHGLYADALPFPTELSISAGSVAIAATYGFLVSALFTLWPLGQAELVSPAVLFRDQVQESRRWPRPAIVAALAAIGLVLAASVVLSSDSQRIAGFFVVGLVLVFAVFLAVGWGVTRIARMLPRSRRPELALALANIGAPGGLTRSVVLSLGAGLSLLVAVALADASLVRELTTRLPDNSPNYFLLDIPKADYPAVETLVRKTAPDAVVESAPMLRGRLVRLGDRPVETIKAPPEAEWVLRGDRGLTYAEDVPAGSKVVAGTWWAKDYDGEPLVSFEGELARQLGVGIGDLVTVNVLGRNVSARIANLREVNWESLAINFVMVFSPNTLKGAPHNLLATVTLPKTVSLAAEADVARAVGKAYPTVTAIRVKDAINAFSAVFAKIMTAVRVAGAVTLVAGALVLAGALATAQRRRILEAVILKALGATRRRILSAHVLEYLIIAAATAGFAVGFGALAAWVALEQVMDVAFSFSWAAVALALGLSSGLVVIFGGIGTWQVLRARPVPYLRSE
ncbi:MAG: FtsX-like permease family protein [Hyphomicrobiaceae bacterium]|nr:FtsX-like permease family protein [Hyphomicrobiaceae bacterium]